MKASELIDREVVKAISKNNGKWLTAREIWNDLEDKRSRIYLKGLTQLSRLLETKYKLVFRNRTGNNYNEYLCELAQNKP